MKPLHLAAGLDLPAEDLLESAIGVIAKRGRGKSGTVKVLMEELHHAGLPFVAFDPVGILWGIRSSFDGTGPGLPVLVVGGEHGDLPLDRKGGAKTAQQIIRENVSCVIDFSEEPKAAYREFVRDFAHELFRRNDTPRLVILEEAPELVPQRVMGDRAETFEAVERLVSRGRNKGIGVVLVSQRAATINKDVLTQVDAMIVLGLASPQDRKALGEWIGAWDVKKQAERFDRGLAGLHVQEAWFWSPEAFGGIFRKVKIRPFTTFHPDKTHLRRMGWLKVRPVTADVSGVVARIKGERPKPKEENVDEKERRGYEEDGVQNGKLLATLNRTVNELRAELKKEHDRGEANAKVAAANAVTAVKRSPVPSELAAGLGEHDQVDLHVERPVPSLVVVDKVVRIDASGEENEGRMGILLAEGFFNTHRANSNVRDEFRRRGWGSWIGGGGNESMNALLLKFCEWGFLFRIEGNKRVDYEGRPEALKRITVKELEA